MACQSAEDAFVCNSTGNNYDVKTCPFGCAAGGCSECESNAQCSAPAEICDPTARACRACTSNDECESGVCESGTCVPPAGVLHASPTGDTTGSCPRAQPCTLERALMLAVNAPATPIVKLATGTYSPVLSVLAPTPQPLRILGGPGVVLGSTSGLTVQNGASVVAEQLEFLKDSVGLTALVTCGDTPTSDPISTVKLVDSKLNYRAGGGTVINTNRCSLELSNVELGFSGASYVLGLSTDTTAILDRVVARPIAGLTRALRYLSLNGQRINLTITNSLFLQTLFLFNTSDQAPPYSQHLFAFNTFVFEEATGGTNAFECGPRIPTDYNWSARVENNIIYAPANASAIAGLHCATQRNLVVNISGAAGSNIVDTPQFVDTTLGNYRLTPASPGVNAALPSADLTTDHDLDATARPQGTAHDIGAYELVP